jgi:hypothetical protein
MSVTIMPNAINTGVRRLTPLLSGFESWGLGASPDIIAAMTALGPDGGYDPATINSLVAAGATDAQLQNLWDNYGAGTPEFAFAANQLLQVLTGRPGATGGGGYPSAAIPSTVSTAFGIYDLSQQWAWDQINSQLSSVRDQINQVGRLAPKDPDVVQHVRDFNARVGEFAGYYQQLFGNAPSTIPFASTLGVLGLAPLVIPAAIIAAVVAIIAIAYSYSQWAQTKRAQIAAQSQAAVISAIPAGSTPAQVASILNPGTSPTDWSAWLQKNMPLLIVALAGIVIVPPLLRRR